jgi:hypothetical protein
VSGEWRVNSVQSPFTSKTKNPDREARVNNQGASTIPLFSVEASHPENFEQKDFLPILVQTPIYRASSIDRTSPDRFSYYFGFWILDFGLETVGSVSVLDVDRSQSFFKLGASL